MGKTNLRKSQARTNRRCKAVVGKEGTREAGNGAETRVETRAETRAETMEETRETEEVEATRGEWRETGLYCMKTCRGRIHR